MSPGLAASGSFASKLHFCLIFALFQADGECALRQRLRLVRIFLGGDSSRCCAKKQGSQQIAGSLTDLTYLWRKVPAFCRVEGKA